MDRYWRQEFAGNPAVVGMSIAVAGKPVTIVGVAARRFRGLDLSAAPDLYLPLHTIADVVSTSTNYFAAASHASAPTAGLRIIGRLRADDRPALVAGRLSATLGSASPNASRLELTSINAAAVPAAARSGMVRFAQLLSATMALLMLVGCGTVGLLLLLRTETRVSEFATCLALGAPAWQLVGSIALEGVWLTIAGTSLAIPVSWWMLLGLRSFQLPGNVNIALLHLAIDGRVAFAFVGSAVVSVVVIAAVTGVFSVPPRLARSALSPAGSSGRVTRPRVHALLVVGQVAVSLVLLAGSTLLVRSLQAALSLNPGVGMNRILVGSVSLVPSAYPAARATQFFDELRERLRINPAIEAVAYGVEQGGMGPMGKLTVEGEPRGFPTLVEFRAVDATYFRTVGISTLAGRDFSARDSAAGPRVALVSESFARQLAGGSAAIGRRLTMPSRAKTPVIVTIVGVVSDLVTDVSVLEPLVLYLPATQREVGGSRLIAIRARDGAATARRELLATIKQLDSDIVPGPFRTLSEGIERQMGPQRLGAAVLGALGGVAFLLTILGTYVLSESVFSRRMHELAIKSALGASGWQLAAQLLTDTSRLVGAGLLTGLVIVWLGSSTITAFLFQIEPMDLATITSLAATIYSVTLAVTLRPALRAARLDVARILRAQ